MTQLDLFQNPTTQKISQSLEGAIISINEGASDEKRMGLDFLERLKQQLQDGELIISKPISNELLRKILIDFMKILIPFIPHVASESLEKLGEKNTDKWPIIKDDLMQNLLIKVAIQINGKTREIIDAKQNLPEKDLIKLSKDSAKVNKHLQNKNVQKIIFVKNKILNYLTD